MRSKKKGHENAPIDITSADMKSKGQIWSNVTECLDIHKFRGFPSVSLQCSSAYFWQCLHQSSKQWMLGASPWASGSQVPPTCPTLPFFARIVSNEGNTEMAPWMATAPRWNILLCISIISSWSMCWLDKSLLNHFAPGDASNSDASRYLIIFLNTSVSLLKTVLPCCTCDNQMSPKSLARERFAPGGGAERAGAATSFCSRRRA